MLLHRLTGKQAKEGEAITEEEEWPEYKTEIEEIKNAGKQKTLTPVYSQLDRIYF